MIEPHEILFIGLGKSAVGWYRAYLPALALGADWVGVVGTPPTLHVATGQVRKDTVHPNYDDYKVIIVQQPMGGAWLTQIKNLQARGIKVLFEVDDYLHGVRKQEGHDFAKAYNKKTLKALELNMRVCDGIICSTEYIARRYRAFNRNCYVCENGIDLGRYALTRPERETVNIGWAGATGHVGPMAQWIGGVLQVLNEREQTTFVSIGVPQFAQQIQRIVGEGRAFGTPWTMIENYPAAMTMLDIAIAPAGKTAWYRGKSDLRWLEAGALGIPIVADPDTYPRITHGVDGFHAETPDDARELVLQLVDDPDLRSRVGEAAHRYVKQKRDIRITSLAWLDVARAVVGEYESACLVRV